MQTDFNPETHGAFVQIDINALDKHQCILLGMQTAVRNLHELVEGMLKRDPNFMSRANLLKLTHHLKDADDEITTKLLNEATRTKAANIHFIPKLDT